MRVSLQQIRNEAQAQALMRSLKVSIEGIKILSPKSVSLAFLVKGVNSAAANVIKQQMLSLGSDAAVERDVLVKNKNTDVLIFGNLSQLKKLSIKLNSQPWGLKDVSFKLSRQIDALSKTDYQFCARGKRLRIKKPLICGIINTTPDSFSGDGLLKNGSSRALVEAALAQAKRMVKAGAKILDIGGESTRPFSKKVTVGQEIKRVVPVIKALRRTFPKLLLSVDTYKYKTAQAAVEAGVDIINDITALRGDPRMVSLIKRYKLGCVLMHMKGSPLTMQANPHYDDVIAEIIGFFTKRLEFIEACGIPLKQVMIDPGIGFGKRVEDNLKIINNLENFKVFGRPLFIGVSRKSFIARVLKSEAGARLSGTIAAALISVIKGARIVRVHDVKEISDALKITEKIFNEASLKA